MDIDSQTRMEHNLNLNPNTEYAIKAAQVYEMDTSYLQDTVLQLFGLQQRFWIGWDRRGFMNSHGAFLLRRHSPWCERSHASIAVQVNHTGKEQQ